METLSKNLCKVFQEHGEYQQEKDKLASTVGHFIVQSQLLQLGTPVSTLETLHKGEFGKWQLSSAAIDFNISHSGDKVIVAVSNEGLIGVDIEQDQLINWAEYQGLFTSTEWTSIQQSSNPNHTFLDFWVKKESVAKAFGYGLQIPLETITLVENKVLIQRNNLVAYLYPLAIPGYHGCVCSSKEVQRITTEEFKFA